MMHSFIEKFWLYFSVQLSKKAPELYLRETSAAEVEARIKDLISKIYQDLLAEKLPAISFPEASSSAAFDYSLSCYTLKEEPYSEAKHCRLTLNPKANTAHFAYLLKVLERVYDLVVNGRFVSKREIYYGSPFLFRNQSVVDYSIEEVAVILKTTRDSLNISASSKGLVYGSLSFKVDNDKLVDCCSNSFSSQSELIPKLAKNISHIQSEAAFILVVEKETVYYKLISEEIPVSYTHLTLPTIYSV
eukprot:TRINITY_DN1535_c0_g1_i15.p1 TRINITY_DN1535_c0_g1~~TRINITY_DN1535_c0_g1_i15.p1  ORF type:complete len:246 (-),score=35.57 TRINITY_DN1535_c0_g1_i15:42-779(-)